MPPSAAKKTVTFLMANPNPYPHPHPNSDPMPHPNPSPSPSPNPHPSPSQVKFLMGASASFVALQFFWSGQIPKPKTNP